MVYFGALSKGCERCRQRKVKCDLQKPGCGKCEKYGQQCPGYRSLARVMFRDESARIIKRTVLTQKTEESSTTSQLALSKSNMSPAHPRPLDTRNTNPIHRPIACCFHELGVNFFARKYSLEGPSAVQQLGWLKNSHLEGPRTRLLRMAVEAVGLAGLSNIHYAPQVAIESRKEYCKALRHLQQNLNDPVQAITDVTLMTTHLLVLFEMINFDNWKQYDSWATHVRAVSSLLALRGKDQFDRDRGTQLYLQVRTQIVSACLQQRVCIPPSLVHTSYMFHLSTAKDRWREKNLATSGSICEIAFRIVNLRAALHHGEIKDPYQIHDKALEIERDLETWKLGVHPHWRYEIVEEADSEYTFAYKRHIYPTVWVAEAWNGWRAMRILANQIMIQNPTPELQSEMNARNVHVCVIREMSEDICVSVKSFKDSPRLLSLIEPLYCVAQEMLNDAAVRAFAIRQLRCINATMGVRQAALFADSATKQLGDQMNSAALQPREENLSQKSSG